MKPVATMKLKILLTFCLFLFYIDSTLSQVRKEKNYSLIFLVILLVTLELSISASDNNGNKTCKKAHKSSKLFDFNHIVKTNQNLITFFQTFTVDEVNNVFLKDGKEFRYVAGSFHYFRALPETWKSILRRMRASGLNAVDM